LQVEHFDNIWDVILFFIGHFLGRLHDFDLENVEGGLGDQTFGLRQNFFVFVCKLHDFINIVHERLAQRSLLLKSLVQLPGLNGSSCFPSLKLKYVLLLQIFWNRNLQTIWSVPPNIIFLFIQAKLVQHLLKSGLEKAVSDVDYIWENGFGCLYVSSNKSNPPVERLIFQRLCSSLFLQLRFTNLRTRTVGMKIIGLFGWFCSLSVATTIPNTVLVSFEEIFV
jgi:hypothetical protein